MATRLHHGYFMGPDDSGTVYTRLDKIEILVAELRAIVLWDSEHLRKHGREDQISFRTRQMRRGEIIAELRRLSQEFAIKPGKQIAS